MEKRKRGTRSGNDNFIEQNKGALNDILRKLMLNESSELGSQGEGDTPVSEYIKKLLKDNKSMETLENIFPQISNPAKRTQLISYIYNNIEKSQNKKKKRMSLIKDNDYNNSDLTNESIINLNNNILRAESIFDLNLRDIIQTIQYIYDEVTLGILQEEEANDLVSIIKLYGPSDFVDYHSKNSKPENIISENFGENAERIGHAYVNYLKFLGVEEHSFQPLSCYTSPDGDPNIIELHPLLQQYLNGDLDWTDEHEIAFIYAGMHATIALHVYDKDGKIYIFSLGGLLTGEIPTLTNQTPGVIMAPVSNLVRNALGENALSNVWIASIDPTYQPFRKSTSTGSYVRTFAPVILKLDKDNVNVILKLSKLTTDGGNRSDEVVKTDDYNIGYPTNILYSVVGCSEIGTSNCATIAMLIGKSQGVITNGYPTKLFGKHLSLPIDNPQTMGLIGNNKSIAKDALKRSGNQPDPDNQIFYDPSVVAEKLPGVLTEATGTRKGGSKLKKKTRKHKKSKKTKKIKRKKNKKLRKSIKH
jgi:hypothetical protein